jgi:hypothetical protein
MFPTSMYVRVPTCCSMYVNHCMCALCSMSRKRLHARYLMRFQVKRFPVFVGAVLVCGTGAVASLASVAMIICLCTHVSIWCFTSFFRTCEYTAIRQDAQVLTPPFRAPRAAPAPMKTPDQHPAERKRESKELQLFTHTHIHTHTYVHQPS